MGIRNPSGYVDTGKKKKKIEQEVETPEVVSEVLRQEPRLF